MTGTMKLGGIGLVAIVLVGIMAVAFIAIANPANPVNPPKISFSTGGSSLSQADYDHINEVADLSIQTSITGYEGLSAQATIKSGKMIHETIGPITYVISSGLSCFTNMSMWFFGQDGDDPKVKHESEGSGPCTPEKVNKMLNEFVRRGIEAGLSLETMNEIRSAMQQSIWSKFGW